MARITPMDELLAADVDAFRCAATDDLDAARQALAALKALPDDADPVVAAQAYDRIGVALDRTAGLASLLFQVHPDEALREVAAGASQELDRFATEVSLDRAVYERLSRLDPAAAPDDDCRRVLERALRDYRRAGVDRDEATRARITALRAELVEHGQAFGRAISGDVRQIELESPVRLAGLPDDFVASHPPDERGVVTITTDPPDLMPFLQFAHDREARLELARQAARRATPDNLVVLDRLIAARHELAGLLGYPSWAAYVTEDKMILTDRAAVEFVARVSELAAEKARQETLALTAELRELGVPIDGLREGDRLYLTERLRSRRFGFDSRDMRPYLGYRAVLGGVFDTIERLFGLSVVPRPDLPVWHPQVEAYDLLEDGRPLARFLLDMHPRPNKFKHAAMFQLTTGELPRAALVCNLPRPTETDPGLLDPNQVKTLFHEFGHLLHHLLAGRQRWHAFAGIATEWDFVEVPSQLFEEWPKDARVLRRFARHHATGEPVPTDMVERMNAASAFGRGLEVQGQMFYAAYSLECFRRDPDELDTSALVEELKPRFLPFPVEPGTAFQASFGHLDGYSALYYTYMWSLTLAKDCLSAFGGDCMDGQVAARYRRTVLEPGGRRDAADLLSDFLGREPKLDAFEAWLGA